MAQAPKLRRRSSGGGRRDRGGAGRGAAVELHGPALEGADHQPHRLVEDGADDRLQQAGAELEVDEELELACPARPG